MNFSQSIVIRGELIVLRLFQQQKRYTGFR